MRPNWRVSACVRFPALPDMRFKIDENLPVEVCGALRAAGHNAASVHEQRLAGYPDGDVASVCRAEDRVIVTLDVEFGDIRRYPPRDYAGIVVLRLSDQSKPAVLGVLERVIGMLEQEPLGHRLWIVDETTVRMRE